MTEATANLSNPGASATSMDGAAAAAPAPAAAPALPQWIVAAAIGAALLWTFSRKG